MGKLFNLVVRFFLLAIVYYGGADLYLIDTEIADINNFQAILISLGSILFGWIIYNTACKSPLGNNSNLLLLLLFSFYYFCHCFIHLFLVEELHFYI